MELLGHLSESDVWVVSGLVIDLIGVVLLGLDVVRVQLTLKQSARKHLDEYENIVEEFDGIQSWVDELGAEVKNSDRVPRRVAATVPEYRLEVMLGIVPNMANCISGQSEQLSKLMALMAARAEDDAVLAKKSVLLTYVGLAVIAVGFAIQIVGVVAY